jgi:hypothetical protein
MLVNMIGVEESDEIVDLKSRRADGSVDPKARVTLTTLLGAMLTTFKHEDVPVRAAQGALREFAAAYDKVFGRQSINGDVHQDAA